MYEENEKSEECISVGEKFERLPAVVGSLSQSSRKYKRKQKSFTWHCGDSRLTQDAVV
jgi:hypothetical protein